MSGITSDQFKTKQRIKQRRIIALASFTIWLMLSLWCASAFWQHIDALNLTYPVIAKIGALSAEAVVFFLIILHCFSIHIGTRKWALILGILLSICALVHAGALQGMHETKTAQIDTEQRLKDSLTDMSAKQAAAITADNTGTQKERIAKNRAALEERGKVATNAQNQVAAAIKESADKVKDSSTLPRWYLDGWMYSLLFALSLICLGVPCFLTLDQEDVDRNYDGIPDKDQQTATTLEIEADNAADFVYDPPTNGHGLNGHPVFASKVNANALPTGGYPDAFDGVDRIIPQGRVTRIKPPKLSGGFFFRKNGEGWDLRRNISDGQGGRRQVYVGYLSREKWNGIKASNRTEAKLREALSEWLEMAVACDV